MSRRPVKKKPPARARKSRASWDEFLVASPKRGVDRAVGRFLLVNWKILVPMIVWIVAQLIGYSLLKANVEMQGRTLAKIEEKVDRLVERVYWVTRGSTGPVKPIE